MDISVKRVLGYCLPIIILVAWRFHFGQIYCWFPMQFATRYHPEWKCWTIQIPGGGMCEDIIEMKESGMAMLTCDSNRRKWNTVMVRRNCLIPIDIGTVGGSESKRTIDSG